MINTLSTNNYGCLRAVELGLTPVHALIGPNDGGKSTLLRAMRTLGQFAAGAFSDGGRAPFDPWLPSDSTFDIGLPWLGARTPRGSYHLTSARGHLTEEFDVPVFGHARLERALDRPSGHAADDNYAPVLREIGPARLVRFDAEALRRPTPVLRGGAPVDFADDRGTGLASVLQAMNGRDVERFVDLQRRAREQFPAVARLQVTFDGAPVPNASLGATLVDGTEVDAARLSEGLLRFLAFEALEFLAPVPLVLVEAPEQGLHPARVRGAVAALRRLNRAAGTQVVVATHSPLVVDELRPDEVTVVTQPSRERGAVATPLERTPAFARRPPSSGLGEFWAARANGVDDAGLWADGPDAPRPAD
jgi:ABC-type transport system involved in cytochrome c biogenesis ATPase subunit